MTTLELFLLAVGLSMDAFAVSITNGLCDASLKRWQMLMVGVCFGGFQGIMPTLGYFLGKAFEVYITNLDHWIALILLAYIGGKMIWDSFHEEEDGGSYILTGKMLFMQGIATSIDALAVGVSFAALSDIKIYLAAPFICCVTFGFSIVGVVFGKGFGNRLGARAQFVGGMILLAIGIKIFAEHMFFS